MPKLFSGSGDDAAVGLMRNQELDLGRGNPVFCQQSLGKLSHLS